jgi:hypothetical protein
MQKFNFRALVSSEDGTSVRPYLSSIAPRELSNNSIIIPESRSERLLLRKI